MQVKEFAIVVGGRAVTQGGIRACVKEMKKGERVIRGFAWEK